MKFEWEGLATLAIGDADAWEDGLLIARHIAVVAGGVRRLLVIGVENLAQGQIGVVGHVVELKAPAVEVVGANVCPVLPKLHHVNLVLGHQTTAIEGRVDDAETILTARYPRGRDIFGLPAVECFSEGRMHGLCVLVLLSVESGYADGHQQECYGNNQLFHHFLKVNVICCTIVLYLVHRLFGLFANNAIYHLL